MALTDPYYAVIEAGGTKFNCAVVTPGRDIVAEIRIPTTTPEETLAKTVAFFQQQRDAGHAFTQMGIASFGPLDLNPASATYGYITKTPKPDWSHTNLAGHLAAHLACEVTIDTDVNGAALGEYRWGAAQDSNVAVYVTVGTGVGGGVVFNGKPLHGLVHPEIGHMLVQPPAGIQGVCPFHQNCVEGLASGTALGKIWSQPSDTFADDHPAWDGLSEVLGDMCHNLMVTLSAEKIILGGGVMQKHGLVEKVIAAARGKLNDYIVMPEGISLEDIICLPGLDTRSGLFGALALLDS
ncbi:MAG TPA: fructokinase [Alteromonas sp.]|jgi:fructokinase|nr:fructokinase [Alteromonas sp.]HCL10614.1 fructokinase [Alteromonas sp.]HCV19297.1 fructokinase [Alteromonas sp.]|tara:strand:+ start:20 stop:904 length:885 start_codon:yes stop_codon:yes gene_type:complete